MPFPQFNVRHKLNWFPVPPVSFRLCHKRHRPNVLSWCFSSVDDPIIFILYLLLNTISNDNMWNSLVQLCFMQLVTVELKYIVIIQSIIIFDHKYCFINYYLLIHLIECHNLFHEKLNILVSIFTSTVNCICNPQTGNRIEVPVSLLIHRKCTGLC